MIEAAATGGLEKMLHDVLQPYGPERLRDAIAAYAEKRAKANECHMRLAALDEERNEHALEQALRDVAGATQDYYDFIASLPGDMRRFLLRCQELADDDNGAAAIEEFASLFNSPHTQLLSPGLPALQSIRPERYIMPLDAISNQLANLGERSQVLVGRRNGQPVTTMVTLDIPEHMTIEGGGNLSSYDKSIINGVTSLLEGGNMAFTVPMLYGAMIGRPNPTVDTQLYDELSGRLEKMRRMMLTVDLTEENEVRSVLRPDGESVSLEQWQLEGYLLPLNKFTGLINGKKAEVYQIIQHPPLYSYSKAKRQLATINMSLLRAPLNNNNTTIPLRSYLLQRVEGMKNMRNKLVSNTILYASVYQEVGAQDADKTRKMRIRKYTGVILNYFVQQNHIAAWAEFKRGRTVAGVNIQL